MKKKAKPYGRTAQELQGDWSGKRPKKARFERKKARIERKWVEVLAEKPILGYSRTTSELYGR